MPVALDHRRRGAYHPTGARRSDVALVWLGIAHLGHCALEPAAIAAGCALLEVVDGHERRHLLSERGGGELVDGHDPSDFASSRTFLWRDSGRRRLIVLTMNLRSFSGTHPV